MYLHAVCLQGVLDLQKHKPALPAAIKTTGHKGTVLRPFLARSTSAFAIYIISNSVKAKLNIA